MSENRFQPTSLLVSVWQSKKYAKHSNSVALLMELGIDKRFSLYDVYIEFLWNVSKFIGKKKKRII